MRCVCKLAQVAAIWVGAGSRSADDAAAGGAAANMDLIRVLLISLSACAGTSAYESMRLYRDSGTEHRLLRDAGVDHRLMRDVGVEHRLVRDTGMDHRLVRDTGLDHRPVRDTVVNQRLVRDSGFVVDSRRGPRPAYSNDFLEDYEPYAYAAIPIHSPMPVLHVISPSASSTKYRPKKYARPRPQPEREYAYSTSSLSSSSSADQSYENSYSQEELADSVQKPKYTSYYEEEAPVLVYARPNKNGGYTYRKPTAATTSYGQKEPFVIRIHKYKLVRDTRK